MSIGPLKRRSSWPSSFVTGLIGWNGFFIILALVFGQANSTGKFFILASAAAIVQVVILRLLFVSLHLDRSTLAGAVWGGVTGLIAGVVEMQISDLFDPHPILWLLNALYIGIAVGLFLVYFNRDDRRIQQEAGARGTAVDYGRDANWLEPFFFGAVAYLIAFLPASFNLEVITAVIGAVSGVVAAGVSHFFIFTIPRKSVLPVILGALIGAAQGAISGWLFQSFSNELLLSPFAHGAIAGSLTYLATAVRGRSLALREIEAN